MTERLIAKLERLGAEAGIKEMTTEIFQFALGVRADLVAERNKLPVNLTVDELIDLEHKHLRHEDLVQAIKAKLKEKNA
tara:strand:- start:828 stop:1064 length:237 start_codon:yes stop_codon:yes gene_type:complete